MPSIRIGYSTEFVLRNELVGIGSTATSERLDVAGQIRSENTAGSGGVSTFREYQGFSQTEAELSNEVLIDNGSGGPYSSLTGEIKITGETTVSSGSTVEVGKTKTLTATDRFAVPLGETNNRDLAPEPGTTRFNQDYGTLEFFDGANWKTVNSYTRGGAAGRGIFGGGQSPAGKESIIEQVNISSLGNAIRFGDMTTDMNQAAGTASEIRGLLSGGYDGSSRSDNIDYLTIASSGDAIDFGNLTTGRSHPGGCSSSTRSLIASGYPSPDYTNVIDYVEIATVGNAVDFGDVTLKRDELTGLSSPTRGIFAGGSNPSRQSLIEFVSIASKGDAIDFGELTRTSGYPCGGGNGTRGIVVAGNTPERTGHIDQITIATTGNAVDFGGTCALAMTNRGGSACTKTRMVFGGGIDSPGSQSNHIEYITINSNGSGIDFGDLSIPRASPGGLSDSHGGLGGF